MTDYMYPKYNSWRKTKKHNQFQFTIKLLFTPIKNIIIFHANHSIVMRV